jgi:hypothetical protein
MPSNQYLIMAMYVQMMILVLSLVELFQHKEKNQERIIASTTPALQSGYNQPSEFCSPSRISLGIYASF